MVHVSTLNMRDIPKIISIADKLEFNRKNNINDLLRYINKLPNTTSVSSSKSINDIDKNCWSSLIERAIHVGLGVGQTLEELNQLKNKKCKIENVLDVKELVKMLKKQEVSPDIKLEDIEKRYKLTHCIKLLIDDAIGKYPNKTLDEIDKINSINYSQIILPRMDPLSTTWFGGKTKKRRMKMYNRSKKR